MGVGRRRIAFSSRGDGPTSVYWKLADGSGPVERLTEVDNEATPYGFSADGQLLFRAVTPRTGSDLRMVSPGGSPELLLSSEHTEANAEASPNGTFIAYDSDASGRPEVYVRPFPNVTDGQWQVSAGGGTRPLWARNGRELFFLTLEGELMAAPVRTAPSFTHGAAEMLLGGHVYAGHAGPPGRTYDISPDGQRFLMIKEASGDQNTGWELILVQNWFEELKRLVPTSGN